MRYQSLTFATVSKFCNSKQKKKSKKKEAKTNKKQKRKKKQKTETFHILYINSPTSSAQVLAWAAQQFYSRGGSSEGARRLTALRVALTGPHRETASSFFERSFSNTAPFEAECGDMISIYVFDVLAESFLMNLLA